MVFPGDESIPSSRGDEEEVEGDKVSSMVRFVFSGVCAVGTSGIFIGGVTSATVPTSVPTDVFDGIFRDAAIANAASDVAVKEA